jgi:hypothetical protein
MAAEAAIHATGNSSVHKVVFAVAKHSTFCTVTTETCVDGRLHGHDEKEGIGWT